MLNSLSEHIADFLLRQKCFEEEMLPVYVYGIKVFLSSVIGVALVLITSCILGAFESGFLFLLTFIILRQFTGGLHCNSYIACNITTVLTFVLALILKHFVVMVPYSNYILCLMMIVSIIITSIFAPVSHPNKEIEAKDRMKFRFISLGILLIHIVITVICSNWFSTEIIVTTDFLSGVYIIIGLIKNNKERRKQYEAQKNNS